MQSLHDDLFNYDVSIAYNSEVVNIAQEQDSFINNPKS